MMNEAALALAAEGEHKLGGAAHVALLERLKHLAEGKLHLELEHARYTMQLAATVVAEGRKREASDMLATVQIETITSMPRLEKLECILNQIQLTLDIDEPSRTAVLSRKINPRALGKEDTKALKVRYFLQMIEHYARQPDVSTLLIARCWHEIFLTVPEFPAQDEDADEAPFGGVTHLAALGNTIMYAVLAAHVSKKDIVEAAECVAFTKESAQTDRAAWLLELLKHRDVRNELPTLEALLKAFTGVELIHTTLVADVAHICATYGMAARAPQLVSRLSEHDILVVAKYYKRIRLDRLAALVGLEAGPTEQFLMAMVSTKSIYAKMDRIDAVVVFEKQATPVDVETQWNKGVDQIATLVDRMCHLVSKERMISSSAQVAQ
jgi:26S proteasome regulatory subunit N5